MCGPLTRACQVEGAAESIMRLPPLRGPQRTRIANEINGMGERTHRLVDKIRDLNVRAAHRCFLLATKVIYVQL
jgi:hypothetical protein